MDPVDETRKVSTVENMRQRSPEAIIKNLINFDLLRIC